MHRLSLVSLERLQGVHPKLAEIVHRAAEISDVEFRVMEGVRDRARQELLLRAGASSSLESRHITGHAVDVVPIVQGMVRWDWPLYTTIAQAFKKAGDQLGTPIEWGGDWKKNPDGPHFQLRTREFPDDPA